MQALQQVLGGDIHQADLHRVVEEAVGNGLPDDHPGDLGYHVVQALEVLNVDRGVDVDAAAEEFLHVLPALLVARTRGVGVGELVHEGNLWPAGEHRVQVHLGELDPHILDARLRQDFQPLQEGVGLGAAV